MADFEGRRSSAVITPRLTPTTATAVRWDLAALNTRLYRSPDDWASGRPDIEMSSSASSRVTAMFARRRKRLDKGPSRAPQFFILR